MRLMETAGLPSIKILTPPVLLQMAQAAQAIYDRWEVDEEGLDPDWGEGGICQDVAEAMQGVLNNIGVDTVSIDNQGIDNQHVWLVGKFREGVYEIDIPPSTYETGYGYKWRKIPGVTFEPSDIVVAKFSDNPEDFDTQFGAY